MEFSVLGQILRVLAVTALVIAGLVQPSPTYAAGQTQTAGQNRTAKYWDWPMKPAQLSSGFDRPAKNWLPGHRGVDLVGQSGDQVLAAGNGVVTFAGLVASKGVVVIRHGTLRTTYEPVSATVTLGSRVRVGDVIGTLAPSESHCSTNTAVTCLHWGLIRGKKYLNPLSLVQQRVRLLPAR